MLSQGELKKNQEMRAKLDNTPHMVGLYTPSYRFWRVLLESHQQQVYVAIIAENINFINKWNQFPT